MANNLREKNSLTKNQQKLPLADQLNSSMSDEELEEINRQSSESSNVDNDVITERTDFTRKVVSLKSGTTNAKIAQLVNDVGGTVVGTAGSNNVVVKLPEDSLKEAEATLSQSNDVSSVETDFAVSLSANIDWGVTRVQAPEAWDVVTGNGVSVAVLDTGIDTDNPELSGKISAGYDFINNDSDPEDGHGHGTAVSGIVAAAQNGTGLIGTAKGANLMAGKVLGDDGVGYISSVIAGIDWAVENNARVINMSLGTTYNSSHLKDAVDRAAANGVTVIAASGNNSGGPLLYPAAYDSVIAIGATDKDDNLASFSALGSELVAPGVGVAAPWINGGYVSFSGTSASAPHVSGLAALLIAHDVGNVRQALQKGTVDLGDEGYDSYYGHGLPEAPKVLSLAEEDEENPVISFVTPQSNQTLTGQHVVHVKASDNREILKVDFLISGELISSNATDPYKWRWDLQDVDAGTYTLTARAFDEEGNMAEKSIEVKVINTRNQDNNTGASNNRSTGQGSPTPTTKPNANSNAGTAPTPTIPAPPHSSVKKVKESPSANGLASPSPTTLNSPRNNAVNNNASNNKPSNNSTGPKFNELMQKYIKQLVNFS